MRATDKFGGPSPRRASTTRPSSGRAACGRVREGLRHAAGLGRLRKSQREREWGPSTAAATRTCWSWAGRRRPLRRDRAGERARTLSSATRAPSPEAVAGRGGQPTPRVDRAPQEAELRCCPRRRRWAHSTARAVWQATRCTGAGAARALRHRNDRQPLISTARPSGGCSRRRDAPGRALCGQAGSRAVVARSAIAASRRPSPCSSTVWTSFCGRRHAPDRLVARVQALERRGVRIKRASTVLEARGRGHVSQVVLGAPGPTAAPRVDWTW